MEYTEVHFSAVSGEDYLRDLFTDALAGIGFDTFEETENGFKAYQPSATFDAARLDGLAAEYRAAGLRFEVRRSVIPPQNWNAVWESNFEPLLVSGQCYVRATFHTPHPEYPYEIVIDPKMAFGTGHHDTTSLMIACILDEDMSGKRVLDMGSGTGILAILAAKAGAADVVAIDNDPVCYDSALENARLNDTPQIACLCGSKDSIPDRDYDIILANINRNILLDQLPAYRRVLAEHGILFLSGFYHSDLPVLEKEAGLHGLQLNGSRQSGDWSVARFTQA